MITAFFGVGKTAFIGGIETLLTLETRTEAYLMSHPYIHPFSTAYPVRVSRWGLEPILAPLGEGGIHPGQVISSSQG